MEKKKKKVAKTTIYDSGRDLTPAVLQAERCVEAVILISAKQCLRDRLKMLKEGDVRQQHGEVGGV